MATAFKTLLLGTTVALTALPAMAQQIQPLQGNGTVSSQVSDDELALIVVGGLTAIGLGAALSSPGDGDGDGDDSPSTPSTPSTTD